VTCLNGAKFLGIIHFTSIVKNLGIFYVFYQNGIYIYIYNMSIKTLQYAPSTIGKKLLKFIHIEISNVIMKYKIYIFKN
jgi:hypothetical protein